MESGFNIDGLMDDLAERVAAKLHSKLTQDSAASVKPRLVTVEQAAVYLARTEEAMRHLIASGKIRTVKVDRRVQIDLRDLDRLIEENKT